MARDRGLFRTQQRLRSHSMLHNPGCAIREISYARLVSLWWTITCKHSQKARVKWEVGQMSKKWPKRRCRPLRLPSHETTSHQLVRRRGWWECRPHGWTSGNSTVQNFAFSPGKPVRATPPFQRRQAQRESGVHGNVPAPFGAGKCCKALPITTRMESDKLSNSVYKGTRGRALPVEHYRDSAFGIVWKRGVYPYNVTCVCWSNVPA